MIERVRQIKSGRHYGKWIAEVQFRRESGWELPVLHKGIAATSSYLFDKSVFESKESARTHLNEWVKIFTQSKARKKNNGLTNPTSP